MTSNNTNDPSPGPRAVAAWYNQRYLSGKEQSFGRPPEESRRRLKKLPPLAGLRTLDVACGQGYFLAAAQGAGSRVFGIDIAFEGAVIAQHVSTASHVVVASGQQLPFSPHTFDVLTCWGALEHHPDMAAALAEFARVTRPGGAIFLRVPNRSFWIYRLKDILGLGVGTEQQDVIEHLLNLEEWETLFRQASLSISAISPDQWFLQQPFDLAQGILPNFRLALRKFSLAIAPLRYTYCFDFLCVRL